MKRNATTGRDEPQSTIRRCMHTYIHIHSSKARIHGIYVHAKTEHHHVSWQGIHYYTRYS